MEIYFIGILVSLVLSLGIIWLIDRARPDFEESLVCIVLSLLSWIAVIGAICIGIWAYTHSDDDFDYDEDD